MYACVLVNKKKYRMKVAPIARPTAFRDPPVFRCLIKTSLAISKNDARDDMFAVLAIILKKTISNGVITTAIAIDEANVANSRLMNRYF